MGFWGGVVYEERGQKEKCREKVVTSSSLHSSVLLEKYLGKKFRFSAMRNCYMSDNCFEVHH